MPFPYNRQTYHDWMEAIAIHHVDILHNPDRSAKHDVAFGEIFLSSDPFEKIDISTFMADVKSKIKFPCLIAVGTDWEADGQGTLINKLINASFIVLDQEDKTEPDKASQRRAAYTKTERIAEEITAYIKEYFRINTIYGAIIKQPVGEPIGPVSPGNFYGTKISFQYMSRYSAMCFDQDKFGLLIPFLDSVPGCCDPEPDYCDILAANITSEQRACLMVNVSNSDNSFEQDINPRTNYELQDIVVTVKDENGTVIGTFVRPAAIDLEVTVSTGGGAVGLTVDQVDQNSEDLDVFSEDEIYA
mgnify:FL=1